HSAALRARPPASRRRMVSSLGVPGAKSLSAKGAVLSSAGTGHLSARLCGSEDTSLRVVCCAIFSFGSRSKSGRGVGPAEVVRRAVSTRYKPHRPHVQPVPRHHLARRHCRQRRKSLLRPLSAERGENLRKARTATSIWIRQRQGQLAKTCAAP